MTKYHTARTDINIGLEGSDNSRKALSTGLNALRMYLRPDDSDCIGGHLGHMWSRSHACQCLLGDTERNKKTRSSYKN